MAKSVENPRDQQVPLLVQSLDVEARAMFSFRRNALRKIVLTCSLITASLVCLPGAFAQADPAQQAAAQATQQANMIAIQAAQQANQQAMQAAQQANQQAVQAGQQAMQASQQAAANMPPAAPPHPGFGRADKPSFSPRPGKFSGSVSVSISDPTTPKSEIFYTLDGSQPTTASTRYTGPITVTASTKLRAIAESPIYSPSRVATGKYVIR
jgi:hypothetical protein